MNLNEKKANEDIETIKMSLEQAATDYSGLSKILLMYGIIQLVLTCLTKITGHFILDSGWYVYIPFTLDMIASIYMVYYYLKIYNKEIINSNKFYLSCLTMWGSIAILLPFIEFFIRVIINFVAFDKGLELTLRLQEYSMLINMILVCFCFIMCSFLIKKRLLVIFSILILFVFLTLEILFLNTNISYEGTIVLYIFYLMSNTIGYIGLSVILRRRIKNGYK